MLTSTDFRGLLSDRFFKNLFPVPATNTFSLGAPAPPFQLVQVQTGETVRLADYIRKPEQGKPGQPVLLEFTRIFTEKQYCPLCFPHIKALNESYSAFQQRGIEVLMITSTDDRQSKIVARDLKLKMPLLSDPTCRVFRTYQLGQALGAPLPAQFLLDRGGKIRFIHLFSFLEPNASIDRLLDVASQLGPG
jgi:peroxiredoxin